MGHFLMDATPRTLIVSGEYSMICDILYSFWEARVSYPSCTRFPLEHQPRRFRNFVADVGLNFFLGRCYTKKL